MSERTFVDGREFAKLVEENKRLRKALAELIDLYESVFREEEELPELDDYRAALQESGTEEDV